MSPILLSCQATYTLLPAAAIGGSNESSALLSRLTMLPNVTPPSVDNLYRISNFPGALSCHTANTLFPDAANAEKAEVQRLLLRLIVLPKVEPPSNDLLYMRSLSRPGSGGPGAILSHATYTVSPETAMVGFTELSSSLLSAIVLPKVSAPSVDLL